MDTVELDARRLKALAHPLRIRLLEQLRTYGPATSTELAQQIGQTTSGTTSWHLRRLAEHGLVQEAAEQPNGRERRWQAAHQVTKLSAETKLAPGNRVASVELLQHILDLQVGWVRAWLAEQYTADPAWVAAAVFHDRLLRLRPDRLAALGEELRRVIDVYQDQAAADEADGADDADARRVAVVVHAFPRADERSPRGAPGRLR